MRNLLTGIRLRVQITGMMSLRAREVCLVPFSRNRLVAPCTNGVDRCVAVVPSGKCENIRHGITSQKKDRLAVEKKQQWSFGSVYEAMYRPERKYGQYCSLREGNGATARRMLFKRYFSAPQAPDGTTRSRAPGCDCCQPAWQTLSGSNASCFPRSCSHSEFLWGQIPRYR